MSTDTIVEITEAELPLHCPTQQQAAWDSHPRVFLDVTEKGEVRCPYCGTLYRMKDWDGTANHAH